MLSRCPTHRMAAALGSGAAVLPILMLGTSRLTFRLPGAATLYLG